MINAETIKNALVSMGAVDEDEASCFELQINSACERTSAALDSSELEQDSRIVNLAFCRALYTISLIKNSANSVVSFKAGDVQITSSEKFVEYAKALLLCAQGECADIIGDEGFAFIGV